MIEVRRVYEKPSSEAGRQFLIDRLWPRGVEKAALHLDGWVKEAAPSNELRQWFGHDPARWDEFLRRYFSELDAHPEAWQPILEAARREKVILLYGAKDVAHNNAVALKSYLEAHL